MGLNEVDIRRVVWTFFQSFLAAFLILGAGALQAPNMDEAKALLISALLAGLAAGLSALKNLLLPDSSSLK